MVIACRFFKPGIVPFYQNELYLAGDDSPLQIHDPVLPGIHPLLMCLLTGIPAMYLKKKAAYFCFGYK